jgi:sodium pump decarboxylase gamma subunit
MTGQGIVLMIAGMSIVYAFLTVLIVITKSVMPPLARFNNLVQDETPRKVPAKVSGSDDENVALAIAVAING